MPISLPARRAYYPASRNEPDHLLCWIPADLFEAMAEAGQIQRGLAGDYPDGLEIPVTREAFARFGLELGVAPEALALAYASLREHGLLPPSGQVDGEALERAAAEAQEPAAGASSRGMTYAAEGLAGPLPEPEMSAGQDPFAVMRDLG
jgi:hypothetical protein